jgi:hypothetical protein
MLRTFVCIASLFALLGASAEAQDTKKEKKTEDRTVRGSMGKIHVEKGKVTQITLIIPQATGKFLQKVEEVKIGPNTQFIFVAGKDEKGMYDAKTVLSDPQAREKFKDDTMAQIKLTAGKQAEWVKFTGKMFGQK